MGEVPLIKQSVFVIANMDCPTEEALIRKRLAAVPGVGELTFNLLERRLAIGHTLPDEQAILGALREIGMQASSQPDACTSCEAGQVPIVPTTTWALMAVSGVAAISAEIPAQRRPHRPSSRSPCFPSPRGASARSGKAGSRSRPSAST